MKKKGKAPKIAVIILICLIIAGVGSFGYYLYKQANSGLFFEETTINGYDVSEMTSKEVLAMLVADYSAPMLELTEGGETALTLTLAQMGYTINEVELLGSIQSCMREQNVGLLFSLLSGNDYEVDIPFEFDETVFKAAVSAANFTQPRITSVDASLEYNGTEYYIQTEVYGNELDDADLQVMVKDSVDKLVAADRPQADLQIAVPESFYFLPAVTREDGGLNTLMNIYNSYCKAKITYTFGSETQVIDWTTIQDWLIIEDGEGYISEDAIYNYVYNLCATYNTLYLPRTFVTTAGKAITFESSDYGYQINFEGEQAQLLADILANTETTREPLYSTKGYTRDGVDDICGNYVEVNLTSQHLWFYKNGSLVVESDIVSGKPTEERETTTGVFGIPYKQTNIKLEGGEGSSAWSVEVEFWMPFHDGQGLHDASWRSSFGGSIYLTDGSHGCVNLPYNVAKKIYENMEERMPIFLYK